MIIVEDTALKILENIPNCPPEIGGILGGDSKIITTFELDKGMSSQGCFYVPNVKRLNKTITLWQENKIAFMGIFHTHFFDVATLSAGDISYITKIMKAMPEKINKLYFPLAIVPKKELIPYVAERNGENINIYRDSLNVEIM